MKSRSILFTMMACCVTVPAFAGDAAVEATIRQMADAFNKGDIAAVKAVHVASPTIVDNVPPFAWPGPDAFDSWLADLGKDEAAKGRGDGHVAFAPVVDEVMQDDRAYVVTRSVYAFKQKGRAMKEDGYTAFVLVKAGADWKVQSWSWASPSAKVAK